MGRAKSLTDSEKQVVLALSEDSKSEREIAERIGRSKNAVHNVIVALRTGRTRHRRGGKRFVTPALVRAMIRRACTGLYSARQLHGMFKCKVSVRRVQKILSGADHLVYKKMTPTPKMNRRHFEARMQWAKDHFGWRRRWARVVFSDKKEV